MGVIRKDMVDLIVESEVDKMKVLIKGIREHLDEVERMIDEKDFDFTDIGRRLALVGEMIGEMNMNLGMIMVYVEVIRKL